MRKFDSKQMLNILVMYALLLLAFQFFRPFGPTEAPPSTQQLEQQAQQLEKQAWDPKLTRQERLAKFDQAIAKYAQIYSDTYLFFFHRSKTDPASINAQYQELRILDEQSRLKQDDTAYYDRAEVRLKDMAPHLLGKSATVTLPANPPAGTSAPSGAATDANPTGPPPLQPTEIADVGKDAERRLAEVRLARDQLHLHDPRYTLMSWLVRVTGSQPWFSYWFALVLLNLVLKALLWPAQKKTFQYSRDMQKIQPLMKQMQEQMKGRPQEEQQKRMMALYKEHNISPAAGCMPMLLQALILIPVFTMIRMYEYQFSKGYFLWIGSALAHRWPAWIAPNLAAFDAPLFVIYMGTTIVSSLLQPVAADPTQRQQQKLMTWMMPVMFGVMMWTYRWSAAFMFYWAVQSIITIWQNWLLLKRFGPPPAAATVPAGAPMPVPTDPLKPMNANGAGGSRRATPARIQPKKRRKGSRA